MTRRYLACIGRPGWPAEAFAQLRREPGDWFLAGWNAADLQMLIASTAPRYVFFLHWSSIVPAAITGSHECVNFHTFGPPAEPMVWHRGGNPIENLIIRGHEETVIGAHRMTQELDAGPVYGLSEPVSLAGQRDDILARFADPVVALIRQIVRDEPAPAAQQGEVVRFGRLEPAAYKAFWEQRQ
jgi:methionyl-tRNA formyltransferase